MKKIIIIGGGVIGSSLAWHLANAGATDNVTVIEPDPSYEFAASPRAVGGIRFVQGLSINLEMSLYGAHIYKNFNDIVDISNEPVDVNYHLCGYLFLGTEQSSKEFTVNYEMLNPLTADIRLMDQRQLTDMLPSFNFADVNIALYSPNDARIDPHSALWGFRKSAEALGVTYLQDKVVDIDSDNVKVTRLKLESGRYLPAEIVINAANCWAPNICRMVGMKIPVEPVRRQTFFFDIQNEIEPFPAIRDHTGISIRQDGTGFLAGKTAIGNKPGFDWNLNYQEFDEHLWPMMANRSQKFEAIKCNGGWVGHYDQNRLDGNPIIGPWVGGLDNFLIATGFSGHGLQHAPAITRGLSELILQGKYLSLDLSIFSYQRILDNRPLKDSGPTP